MARSVILESKRFLFSYLAILLIVCPVFSQRKVDGPTVAVIPFVESERASYGGSDMTDWLINLLKANNEVSAIDKSKIGLLDAELLKGIRDQVSPSASRAAGEKTGARYLIIGRLTEYSEKLKTSLYGVKSFDCAVKYHIQLVESATGQTRLSQSFETRGVSLGDGSKAMQEIATKSLKKAVSALIKEIQR